MTKVVSFVRGFASYEKATLSNLLDADVQEVIELAAATEHGPFDIVGDVHGCFDKLVELMAQLGYAVSQNEGI